MISGILCRAIETYAESMTHHPLLVAAKRGRVRPGVVARYLSSLHYLIRHTPIHLALARDIARSMDDTAVANSFEEKLGDEVGHDVWAENDLAVLSQRFLLESRAPVSSEIVGLVRDLELLIRREPALYLPYIFFAEYLTVLLGPVWIAMLSERCGVPASALSVVSQHAELDREHVEEGRIMVDQLLGPEKEPGVRATLELAMRRFDGFCDELASELDERAA